MVADASETTFAKVRGFFSIELETRDEEVTTIALYIDHAAPAQRAKKREQF
jgi:hypothetical protein